MDQKEYSLVVLAAGMGSRFGGVKQLEPVGPNGELIIDYSINDAVKAGFNKVVFILRRDIYEDFMEVIGERVKRDLEPKGVKLAIVFQDLVDPPEGRTKPWGTGQALLSCRGELNGPFIVINADDFYGRDGFVKGYEFLKSLPEGSEGAYGMIGFKLKNTLSDKGSVTRGLAQMDENGYLTKLDETRGIVRTETGAGVETDEGIRPLDMDMLVSMNMWMLTPDYVEMLVDGFETFKKNMSNPLKDEYLLPDIVDRMLQKGLCTVKVRHSDDRWFGVTYREDLPKVRAAMQELHDKGVY